LRNGDKRCIRGTTFTVEVPLWEEKEQELVKTVALG